MMYCILNRSMTHTPLRMLRVCSSLQAALHKDAGCITLGVALRGC